MKIKPGINLVAFLNEVKRCKSDIWFKSTEGDDLNLKSALSQYVFVLVDPNDELLLNGQLVASKEDYTILADYLIE